MPEFFNPFAFDAASAAAFSGFPTQQQPQAPMNMPAPQFWAAYARQSAQAHGAMPFAVAS